MRHRTLTATRSGKGCSSSSLRSTWAPRARTREPGGTMIAHLRGRENAARAPRLDGTPAEWIALACLHGGVFTRAQWTKFLGCHTEKVRRAVHALIAQAWLPKRTCPASAACAGSTIYKL